MKTDWIDGNAKYFKNTAVAGSVTVSKELYGLLVEYAMELRGAWAWKANSTHRNYETMAKLDDHIKEAIVLRDMPNS